MEDIVESIAENAGRAYLLLEAINDGCLDEAMTLDEVSALSQYALAYVERVFMDLDRLIELRFD